MDSSKNIKKGVLWGSISSFFRYVLQFGGIMILARLLGPSDYGLIGILTVLISVADILIDSGLCGALIKKRNPTEIDYSTLTTYNLVISVVLYTIYYIGAPYIAAYYQQPEIIKLLRLYALTILIFAFTVAPKARLTKDFQFKTLSLINVISGFAGLLIGVILAYNGFGAMSLIGQYLANSIVNTLLIIFNSKYRFKLGFSYDSFKEQFSFGINTTLANILKSVSENIYNNVIGKTTTIKQTGYYTQALRLMNVPTGFFYSIIDNTYFPVMSQIHDNNEFVKKIHQLNDKTFTLIILFFTFAISLNREVVYVLLGEKWIGTEWTLAMLFGAGLFITWGNLGRNVIKSLGCTFLILKYEVLIFVISVSGLFVCSRIGYEAIVICFLGVSLIKAVYIHFLAGQKIGLSIIKQLIPFRYLLLMSLLSIGIVRSFYIDNIWFSLLVKCVILFFVFFFYFFFFKRLEFKKYINKILK